MNWKNFRVESVLISKKIKMARIPKFISRKRLPPFLTQSGKGNKSKVAHKMKRMENPSKTLSTTIVAKEALLEIFSLVPKE